MTNLHVMEEQEIAKFHKFPSAYKVCLYVCIHTDASLFCVFLSIGKTLVLTNRGAF